MGAAWGGGFPEQAWDQGVGDDVSLCSCGCAFWAACGDGCPPNGPESRAGGMNCPAVLVVAPCQVLEGRGYCPKGAGSKAGGMIFAAVPMVACSWTPVADAYPPKGAGSSDKGLKCPVVRVSRDNHPLVGAPQPTTTYMVGQFIPPVRDHEPFWGQPSLPSAPSSGSTSARGPFIHKPRDPATFWGRPNPATAP